MIFNVADLPAVRAQLECDVVAQNDLGVAVQAQPSNVAPPVSKNPGYPSKRLALENGRYHAVDVDEL
jgi:hypothetical protein